jgi:dephospho-CoA kinase
LGILPIVIGRLPNETLALKERGACVIFLYADIETRKQRILDRDGRLPTDEQMNHPVEPKLEDFKDIVHIVLDNSFNANELRVAFDTENNKLMYNNNLGSKEIALKNPVSCIKARTGVR